MKVQAKCISLAWDSPKCFSFYPGETYEIEHDGTLAVMKIGNIYVFEFDRTMTGTGVSPAPGGFICKQCQKPFESLNDLGTHTRSVHKTEAVEEVVSDESVVIEKRGKKKGKTFTCKTCGEVLPNLYAIRVHNKSHRNTAETATVPA
jgi:hypothetical protein